MAIAFDSLIGMYGIYPRVCIILGNIFLSIFINMDNNDKNNNYYFFNSKKLIYQAG